MEKEEKIQKWESQELSRTGMSYNDIWDSLKVGDFISSFNEVAKGEGRGTKILAKGSNYILYSYCENCSPTWKRPCSNRSKEDFIEKLKQDDRGEEQDDRGIIRIYKCDNTYQNMTTIRQTIRKITRKEPVKTFIKVGFIDENEEITEAGRDALTYILWEEKQKELKDLADKIYEQENKDN